MILSMTGFARRERSVEAGLLVWELRSVNHRFLDIGFRLPEDFRRLEPRFRRAVTGVLRRGKIDCSLQFQRAARGPGTLRINEELARSVAASARAVGALMDAPRAMSPMEILRWPGVVEDLAPELDPLHATATELLELALGDVGEARRQEGARIVDMLDSRLQALAGLVAEVRAALPEAQSRMRAKVLERVRQLGLETVTDRLEQELLLLAQRLDVDEEIDRLESHVSAVREVLDEPKPAGRRLDFLLQEMNREANTLAAKSQDVAITRASVDMKVLIEQLREQVQNVE